MHLAKGFFPSRDIRPLEAFEALGRGGLPIQGMASLDDQSPVPLPMRWKSWLEPVNGKPSKHVLALAQSRPDARYGGILRQLTTPRCFIATAEVGTCLNHNKP